VSDFTRGEADTNPEGGLQLLRVVSVSPAGDGYGPEAEGVRGAWQRAADPGSGVGGQLVRVERSLVKYIGLGRAVSRAPASVDSPLVPVRTVFEEQRVLLTAREQDDQLSGVVRRIPGGADVGQQPGKASDRLP